MRKDEVLALVARANEAEVGIIVRTNAPERLRNRLYQALRSLSISMSLYVRGDTIWMVKKNLAKE